MAGKSIKSINVDTAKGLITLVVKLVSPPQLSKSEKSLLYATTSGAEETEVEIDGRQLIANINLYAYKEAKKEKQPK